MTDDDPNSKLIVAKWRADRRPGHSRLVYDKARRTIVPERTGLEINGVGRDKDCLSALVLYFNRTLTDDEMRFIHDVMKRTVAISMPAPLTHCPICGQADNGKQHCTKGGCPIGGDL